MGYCKLFGVLSLGILLTLCLQPQQGNGVHRTLKESIVTLKSILNWTRCINLTYTGGPDCANTTLGDKHEPGLPCRFCFNITLLQNSTECLEKEHALLDVLTQTDRNTHRHSLQKHEITANVTCDQFGHHDKKDVLEYWLSLLMKNYHNVHAKKAGIRLQ
uniref:Ov9.5 protein n=1 Tax=Ovine gammaherpesvirus 2 TaxID=10398 RepID=X5JBR8_9GAMA|nr:Ov9.5 protein precursor [Ovine gammaherpesvirus 2]